MRHFIFIIAVAVMFTASAASAQQNQERWPRWYVGLSGSVVWLQESDVSGLTPSRSVDYDTGYGGGVSLGYMPNFSGTFLNNTRFDLELYYRDNDTDTATVGGVKTASNGDYNSLAYMLNAYYDFNNDSPWVPYVGGGIGWARVGFDNSSGIGNTSESDNVFAYQGMIGLGYQPMSIPMTVWSVGYRYFGMSTPELGAGAGTAEVDYDSHNLEAGVRFRF